MAVSFIQSWESAPIATSTEWPVYRYSRIDRATVSASATSVHKTAAPPTFSWLYCREIFFLKGRHNIIRGSPSSVKTATAGAVLLQDSELAQALAASKLDVDRASACLRLRTWTPTAAAGGERQVKDDCSCFQSVAYAPGANPTAGFFWLLRSTIAGHKGDHRSTESNSKMLVRALEWPVNQWESFKLSARY